MLLKPYEMSLSGNFSIVLQDMVEQGTLKQGKVSSWVERGPIFATSEFQFGIGD